MMSTTEEKLYFLRQVEKQDPHQILQIIQDSILHKGRIRYDDIVLSHAHSTGFLDDTGNTVKVDLKNLPIIEKLYSVYRIPYQENSISMLGNLAEAVYGASIKPEYWEILKQKTKRFCKILQYI